MKRIFFIMTGVIVIVSILVYFLVIKKRGGGSSGQGSDGTCSPSCQPNETCVNGKCVPNPPSPKPCSPSCQPNETCVDGTCVPNTPSPKVCDPACQPNEICVDGKCVPDTGQWEGWATTTQFGEGDGTWPGPGASPGLNLCKKISKQANTMGGAVPWPIIARTYGNRTEYINAIINSATGATSDKACYLVQPIKVFPDQVKGVSDGVLMCSDQASCIDVNDDGIVATMTLKDGSTKPFPKYLIVPYEGCGGDCNATIPDCFNSCSQITDFVAKFDSTLTDPSCQGVNILSNPTQQGTKTWQFDDNVRQEMADAKFDPVAISSDSKYGRDIESILKKSYNNHVNWCSGQNMHFDIAKTNPNWITDLPDGATSNIAQTNAESNIVLRYKRVPCNFLGDFDPSDKPVCFAGGYPNNSSQPCPTSQQYTGSNALLCQDPGTEQTCCCPYGMSFDITKRVCCTSTGKCCDNKSLNTCSA